MVNVQAAAMVYTILNTILSQMWKVLLTNVLLLLPILFFN